ncbi:MAG: RDD family protein [Bacteroidota bacterium]|nr:RDD family protein [Bacteroidota bacterium]MDP4196831.1 RDD family protein [Bacteroidota bacterium]
MESSNNNENNSYMSQPVMDDSQKSSSDESIVSISASRSDRLAAAIVDSAISFIPLILFVRLFYGFGTYLEEIRALDIEFIITTLIAFFILDMVLNGYLLYSYGQTIGKRFMNIRIVDMNDNLPSLTRSYLLRRFLVLILGYIPYVKFLIMVDVFFIFARDKRCFHDYLAGTKVIETNNTRNKFETSKLILIFSVVLVAVFGLFFGKLAFDKSMDSHRFERGIRKVTNDINNKCPIIVDKDVILNNVMPLPKKRFQYNYSFVNSSMGDIDTTELVARLRPKTQNLFRTSPEAKFFRDNGITVICSYKYKDGSFAMRIVLNPESYK